VAFGLELGRPSLEKG